MWEIQGERSLVMNGFDLTPLELPAPVVITAVTLSVAQAVPGAPSQLVIYTDANGGSPVDATLVNQTQVVINTSGTVRVPLAQPVTVNAPVIWVGFYMPVGFEFLSDTSGSSVLTYWGWTPGATFDLNNLGSAAVFGPSDGSAPVNIDLGGIALITIEVGQAGAGDGGGAAGGDTPSFEDPPIGAPIAGGNADLSIMKPYPFCGDLLYDPQDVNITGAGAFSIHCRADLGNFGGGRVRNLNEVDTSVPGFIRRGFLYDVFGNGNYQLEPRDAEKLRVPITHCVRPQAADQSTAVIAIAYGAPRAWKILPTVRFNDVVCAEVTHTGFVSYFTPCSDRLCSVDVAFSGQPRVTDARGNLVERMNCGGYYEVNFAVFNDGLEPTPPLVVRILDTLVRNDAQSKVFDIPLGVLAPGQTLEVTRPWLPPNTYLDERHRFSLIIDPLQNVPENEEDNNVWAFEYILDRNNC